MAGDLTPPESKHYLGIVKHALRSIEFQCRHGFVAGNVPEIQRHVADIRQAADGVELLCGKIKDRTVNMGAAPPSLGMSSYAPGKEKT